MRFEYRKSQRKSGGYLRCLGTRRGICDNKVKARRTVFENIMLQDTKLRRSNTENIQQILKKVEKKVQIIYSDFPNKIRQKKKELALEERKPTNFINFIGEGKGTRSLNQARGQ